MNRRVLPIALLLLLLPATALCGCRRDFTTEADALRAQVMQLEQQIEHLKRQNTELESQIRALGARPESIPEDVLLATPRPARIIIGRFSHARDTTGDGLADTAIMYIQPEDGRGRFVPLVGEVTAHVAFLCEDGEAVTLGRLALDPIQLREVYRSGFAGTHYTVNVPIEWPDDIAHLSQHEPGGMMARIVFIDGHTGEQHEAHGSIRVRRRERDRDSERDRPERRRPVSDSGALLP